MKVRVLLSALVAVVSVACSANAEAEVSRANGSGAVASSPAEGRAESGLKAFFASIAEKMAPRKEEQKVSFTREWIDTRPVAKGDEEWACLAEALYFEARGETVKGQFAVAEVIRNRVASSQFPNTYCGVIHQGTGKRYQCQFTYTCDGVKEVIAERQAYERVAKIARLVLDGVSVNLTDGALYYHTSAVRPRWARRFAQTARIGVHIFYRPKLQTASNG